MMLLANEEGKSSSFEEKMYKEGHIPRQPTIHASRGGFSFCDIFCKLRKGLVIQGEDTQASLKEALI